MSLIVLDAAQMPAHPHENPSPCPTVQSEHNLGLWLTGVEAAGSVAELSR